MRAAETTPMLPSLPRWPSRDHMPMSPTPAAEQSHRRTVSAGWNTAPGHFRAGSNPSPSTSHDGRVPWSRLDCARGPGGLREALACPLRDGGQKASVSTPSTCCPTLSKARAWAEVTQLLLPDRLISVAGPQDGVEVRQPGMWHHQRGRAGELTEAIPCVWWLRGQLRQQLSPGGVTSCTALRGKVSAASRPQRHVSGKPGQLTSVWPGPRPVISSSPLGSPVAGPQSATRPFPWRLQLPPQLLTHRGCSTSPRLCPHTLTTFHPLPASCWRRADLPPSPAQHPLSLRFHTHLPAPQPTPMAPTQGSPPRLGSPGGGRWPWC